MQAFCRNAACSKPSAGAQTMLSWRPASCPAAADAEEPCFSGSIALGLCHHVDGSGPPVLPGHLLPIVEPGNQILNLRAVCEEQASLPTP